MNNPFEEIFKRLENIEKMIAPVTGAQQTISLKRQRKSIQDRKSTRLNSSHAT